MGEINLDVEPAGVRSFDEAAGAAGTVDSASLIQVKATCIWFDFCIFWGAQKLVSVTSVSLRHNRWDITLNHRARRLRVELVPGFLAFVHGLSATITAPGFANLTTVLTGWVFANRHTVTRIILAAGDAAKKHFSSYHRLFSLVRCSLDAVGLAVFDLLESLLETRASAGD